MKRLAKELYLSTVFTKTMSFSTLSFTPLFRTCHHKGIEGGARGVIVIFVGTGHDDTSSDPGRD